MDFGWPEPPLVMRAFINSMIVEVREGGHDEWYVTSGTIFGNQTLKCHSAKCAFEAIDLIASKGDQLLALPVGAELVDHVE